MAAAVKHSKQRDAIEAYLKSTYDHPTADIVYQNVSKEFPNISPVSYTHLDVYKRQVLPRYL